MPPSARAKPIALTGLAAMLGALFILDDPIFNGLAISLVFGILVSTLLTLVVIPVLYYAVNRARAPRRRATTAPAGGTRMNTNRMVRIFAGAFVMISLALGVPGSPLFVSPNWLWFTLFVGANLFQSGITRLCLLEKILLKLGVQPA